jgi:eukaryotic-like serine/threonine-protein kinase
MKVCKTCSTQNEKGFFCAKGHVLYTEPPDDMLIGRILDERYEVRCTLGAGGFGTVYMSAQLKLHDRPCVIKVAKPELAKDIQFAARFEREKKALMALRSRNTVQIIDYGRTEDDIDYIVMEFIEGAELHHIVRRDKRLNQARTINIALGICASLEEAHGVGILHRDLKPANVMLVDLGTSELVKVIDFGIARLADSNEGDYETRTGEMPGTPAYSSYEQMVGQVKLVDERTDIYSLGAIIYEMLTGHAPYGDKIKSTEFDSSTLYYLALAKAKAENMPTPPGQLLQPGAVHPLMDKLLTSMLSGEPSNRPSSANEVRGILERIARLSEAGLTDDFLDGETMAGDHAAALAAQVTSEGLASPAASLLDSGVGIGEVQVFSPTRGAVESSSSSTVDNLDGATTPELPRAVSQPVGPATTPPASPSFSVATQPHQDGRPVSGKGVRWLLPVLVGLVVVVLIVIAAVLFTGQNNTEGTSAVAGQTDRQEEAVDGDTARKARLEEEKRLEAERRELEATRLETERSKLEFETQKTAEAQRKLNEMRQEADKAKKQLADKEAEEARLKLEAEARKDEEEKQKALQDAELKKAAAEEASKKAAAEAARKAARKKESSAASKAAAEAEARADSEAMKKAAKDAETRKKAAEDAAAKKKEAEEAAKKSAAEAAAKKAAEDAAKKKAEEEKQKKLHEKLNFMDDDEE